MSSLALDVGDLISKPSNGNKTRPLGYWGNGCKGSTSIQIAMENTCLIWPQSTTRKINPCTCSCVIFP